VARFGSSLATACVVLIVGAGACSGDGDDQSTAEILAELEGRSLTPAEVAEREEVATMLCGLDDEVLRRIWSQLDADQLEFQDFVFGRQCLTRSALYAEVTGRFATEQTE
jgi:hypothetical protein